MFYTTLSSGSGSTSLGSIKTEEPHFYMHKTVIKDVSPNSIARKLKIHKPMHLKDVANRDFHSLCCDNVFTSQKYGHCILKERQGTYYYTVVLRRMYRKPHAQEVAAALSNLVNEGFMISVWKHVL